ncbi:metallophosphoesterase [Sporosarcina highlanderae]|uniref:Metallophosphoesterase n=1 Tax=Sporosarcina highlanderae TaxID=3035916 RepID=A0ABT8JT49_9BACL|nr:metallophosphoesterase [Sporosarcina highlanderae]MDN4608349.1 metallophosphoesterase [Sporosarcina highlanderae]
MIDVRELKLDKDRRIIITSDVHANLPLFQRLLGQVNYTTEDYLFINGDLCEKGSDSLSTVAFARSLQAESDRVYITKGNCDVLHEYVFNDVEGIKNYMRQRKNSILNEMIERHGKSLDDFNTLQELGKFYRSHFQLELDWLDQLPIAYETEGFIIIHAGIEDIPNWKETSREFALSASSFYDKGHQANKTVIVGHWPVVNYRAKTVSSNSPVIDLDKKIISLDGGNQIKRDGQLNALIIEGEKITYTYVDELNEIIVSKGHMDGTGRVGTVTYPNYELRVIHEDEFFTLCENTNLGIQQWIKNEFIHENMCKNDLSTTFLSVNEGETVSVIDVQQDGYALVKLGSGEVGWIPKDCLL